MYIGRKPQRRSPRLVLFLLILIVIAGGFTYYIWAYEPAWSQPLEPPPTPTRTPQSYIAEAEAYYGQGQLDEAIAAYQQAVSISPENPEAHIRLAQMLLLRQRSSEALGQAQKAVLLDPSNPQALDTLCRALDEEGQYAEAFDACECAIELDPDYAEAYAYLARVYVDTGDWIPARQYAQQAVDLDYQSMDAHYNQGYVLESQGRYLQAVEAYENAIVLNPKLAPLLISVGQNYRVLGRFADAIDRFEKAIRLDPANPLGYDQLGWTYYTAGQYGRAIDSLEQATLIDPNFTLSWGHLGSVYYVLQQYEEVVPVMQEAIRLAEIDYLRRARQVVIIGQDTTRDPPQPIEVMRGTLHLSTDADAGHLSGEVFPILGPARILPKPDQTCGDLIAYQLLRQMPYKPETLEDVIDPSEISQVAAPFLGARGQVNVELDSGLVELQLSGLPQPQEIPYEAQLAIWPDETISLGYFQPDAQGNVSLSYALKDERPAPIDYYTLLGFSYVFLGDCDKGVPWLLDSLDIDPSPSNPAWQGLADCPENPPAEEAVEGEQPSSDGN